jgi:hypothetical protein
LISTAGNASLWCLNTSLVKRLTRLRITAQPTFLLTVIPRRGPATSLSFQTTRKPLTAYLPDADKSLTKSARFLSRTDLGNVLISGFGSATLKLLGGNADGQAFATFCPAPLDYETTVFSGHSYEKTMGPFTRSVAWLKCSFHIFTPENIFQETIL